MTMILMGGGRRAPCQSDRSPCRQTVKGVKYLRTVLLTMPTQQQTIIQLFDTQNQTYQDTQNQTYQDWYSLHVKHYTFSSSIIGFLKLQDIVVSLCLSLTTVHSWNGDALWALTALVFISVLAPVENSIPNEKTNMLKVFLMFSRDTKWRRITPSYA